MGSRRATADDAQDPSTQPGTSASRQPLPVRPLIVQHRTAGINGAYGVADARWSTPLNRSDRPFQGLGRLLAAATAHAAAKLRSLVERLAVTGGDWVESRRGSVVSRGYSGRRIA
jgi:hypothetical protein